MMTMIALALFAICAGLLIAHKFLLPLFHPLRVIQPTEEPDIITRLAAVGDPEGEAAQHVRDWENWIKYRDVMLSRVNAAAARMAGHQERFDDMQARAEKFTQGY